MTKKRLFAGAAVCVAFARALLAAPLYSTSCVVVDATTVEGFVTNGSASALTIAGPVRFIFEPANSMSRPAVVTQSAVIVPPGGTVRVASAQLAGSVLPSETCRFDVSDAIR